MSKKIPLVSLSRAEDTESGESSASASHDGFAHAEVAAHPTNAIHPPAIQRWDQPRQRSPFLARVSQHIPRPIRKAQAAVFAWVRGPDPPRAWKITPIFARLQTLPLRFVDHIAPRNRHKIVLLGAFYFCWLLTFITLLDRTAHSNSIPGYGAPTSISCTATFWEDKNGCGLNGDDCRPFSNSSFAFRCPAHCLAVEQLNPHAVGADEVIYQPLVVGGPTDPAQSVESSFYRGDSFICASALHAGYFDDSQGGCGVLELIGTKANYPAVTQNGISSISFDSNFPLAFNFLPGSVGDCKDARWPLLAVSVIFTVILSLCTTSPRVFFWSVYCILFFHCALVSDPPSSGSIYLLVSSAIGGFLPATFCMAIMYQYCVRRQLKGLTAQVEKTILWLGACWVGTLNDYTFDKIPIQRLTGHDLRQQPGAVTALVIIVLVLCVIVIGQIWVIRREGRLPRYLALYAFVGVCLGLLAAIPQENLRIHHYILALLLLPGTAIQTRPSLLYQGLLVGLFVNGIARWGFASIVQTGGELLGDGILGSGLPVVNQPVVHSSSIVFTWSLDYPQGADGLSVLVNDVERFRGYLQDGNTNFTWTRDSPAGDPEYFRFGYMSGSSSLDYTKAGTWTANRTWIPMEPGAS